MTSSASRGRGGGRYSKARLAPPILDASPLKAADVDTAAVASPWQVAVLHHLNVTRSSWSGGVLCRPLSAPAEGWD